MKNQIFPIFSFWVIVAKEVTKYAQKKLFKNAQIYRKDADWSDNDYIVSEKKIYATLSFWAVVNFSNDCVHNFPTKKGQKWCLTQ